MSESTVCVVGSVNLDLVAVCASLPGPGETVVDARFDRFPGGKGANQALAAQRLGSAVTLIAAVGPDEAATEALELLRGAGVDLSRIIILDHESTGVALIVVDGSGENQIAVASGANMVLSPEHIDASGFDAVLCQFEVRGDVILEAARQAEGLFCVNTAPARALESEIISRADVIIANEGEYKTLADQLDGYQRMLVVTHGPGGSEAFIDGELVARAMPPKVHAVDSVGAGDAFCGALVHALVRNEGIEHALALANAAGAITASRTGAQPSIPTAAEIARIL